MNREESTKFFFETILSQIQQVTNQSRYGYHGLSHTIQVAMFGIDIATSLGTDTLPVMLAAGLHDCARTHDEWCTEHGEKAVPIGREFLAKNYPQISKSNVDAILYAVKNHTTGRIAPDNISACLWDSDRIRLSWERGYRAEFFNTERGHQIASLSPKDQVQYMAQQYEYLIRHNIRTRSQIEFDIAQDRIQDKTMYKNTGR